MASGSRVCSSCGALNSAAERRCHRCGRPLSGLIGAVSGLLQRRQLGTDGIAVLCLLVFAFAVVAEGRVPFASSLGMGEGFRRSTWLRFGALWPGAIQVEPWRLLSAVYFHFDALHLIMNLWGLIAFGRAIEQRFGTTRAFTLFWSTGVAGFVASEAWYGGAFTAGASGGIFGQLGGVIGVIIAQKRPDWKNLVANQIAYALIVGFMIRANTAAHLGGFALGVLLGYLFERETVRRRVTWIFGLLALLGVLGSLGSLGISQLSPLWRYMRYREDVQSVD